MERTYTLQDVLAALRRRKGTALLIGAIVLVVGLALALLTPAEYTASSTVQIEPRRLPADFFPAQGVTPFEDRMRTLKHGILARPVLERVVKETDFFPDVHGEEAIEKLRQKIEVRLEGEVPGGPPALLFVVEVRGPDAQKVTKAADLLPRYYEEMTRDVLRSQARSLRETLDAQATGMSKDLAAYEDRILAFKLQHAPELPEMVDTNARAAARAQSLIEMHLAAITDARRRKTELLAAIPEAPSVPGMSEAALDLAERKLQAAEAAYSPDHPDVKRARREYDEALARRDDELGRYRKERLQEHLGRIDAEIGSHESVVGDLSKELASYQKRVEAAPRWGQELAALSRDYDVLKAKYVSTVSRRADAAAAEQLLTVDGDRLFRTVEAPVTPNRPSAPDRGRLLMLALLAATAAGLGAAGAAEWLDGSMRGPEDAGALGVPVLAAIPRIGPRRTHGA
ncbi:GumC family protein [Anaeromyxobacter oryzae]|uniref:Chain-length determining protein n=1 Tax=Anaeromyxobacter oryzae TaxID=2918170 RepID=A0ABM7X2L6_9BACT|nr:Wzz/FepE/Etk N-terminal domain-containing protein [Anaeromyxobacter oryzae]BDG06013.1 chain-length determining protein [Anaeromyxobacter oryzae]